MSNTKKVHRNPAKRPATKDHKPKRAAGGAMTVTFEGRDWTITPSVLSSFEFADFLESAGEAGQITFLPGALRRLLGDTQYTAAKQVMLAKYGDNYQQEQALEWFQGLMAAIDPNS